MSDDVVGVVGHRDLRTVRFHLVAQHVDGPGNHALNRSRTVHKFPRTSPRKSPRTAGAFFCHGVGAYMRTTNTDIGACRTTFAALLPNR